MSKRLKLLSIAAAVVGIVALSIGGVVLADGPQTGGNDQGPHMGKRGHFGLICEVLGLTPDDIRSQLEEGKAMAEIIADQGFTEEELRDAMLAAMTEQVQEKVTEGTITQEQADRILERMQEGAQSGKISGFRIMRMRKAGHFRLISEVLGLTPDDIRSQLEEGKTMAEIIADQGFTEEELRDAMLAAITEKLQEKVTEGTITQEQADRVMERMQEGAESGMPFGSRNRQPHFSGCQCTSGQQQQTTY